MLVPSSSGLSCDSTFSLKSWATAMGGIRHPLLGDFWPHGAVSQPLGIFNDQVGMAMRTLFIIDPDGVVRHSEMHYGDVAGSGRRAGSPGRAPRLTC